MALDVDPDDYALAAEQDTPALDARTAQSEEEFLAQKASYIAKIEDGDIYKSLRSVLPPPSAEPDHKPKLDKKQMLTITAAAGELYYFHHYETLLEMLELIKRDYSLENDRGRKGKFRESMDRWEMKTRQKQDEAKRPSTAENDR